MLDVAKNRRARNYTRAEMASRVLWSIAHVLFRATPPPFYRLRSGLLRLFGAEMGDHVNVAATVRIAMPWNLSIGDWTSIGDGARLYSLGKITIGRRTTVSQGAHLCAGTHDYRQADMPLRKQPIEIGDDAWICADAFVGPGIRVGRGAVVGARAVVVATVPDWAVVAGNPAKIIKYRELTTAAFHV